MYEIEISIVGLYCSSLSSCGITPTCIILLSSEQLRLPCRLLVLYCSRLAVATSMST
jgi:hypothetical protein